MKNKSQNPPEKFPQTIDEAIELVMSKMSEETITWIREFEGDEEAFSMRIYASFGIGMNVRAILGLWGKNRQLLDRLPLRYRHPDSASHYFIVESFKRLRNNDS